MATPRRGNCTSRHLIAVLMLLALAGCASVDRETSVSGHIDVGVGIQR
ncbi:hypothetical protein [Jeongeupia sp. USM3]|nr:hypothetical protein [Jeongeupia sp. USM3]